MKSKILFFLFLGFLITSIPIYAQHSDKVGDRLYDLSKQTNRSNKGVHFLIQGDTNKLRKLINAAGGIFKYSSGDIASVYAPFSSLQNIFNSPDFAYADIADTAMVLLDDSTIVNNGILKVMEGNAPLSQKYDGEGVVIGIIDNGLDVTHPDFKDENGNSRIKYLWDRTVSGTNSPTGFYYGQEWSSDQIDHHLCTHIANAHGTHVTGVAAGNGLALNKYKGVAPKADIIFVTMNYMNGGSNPLVDGFAYIFKKAKEMEKPCVINASFGYPSSDHSGKDLQSKLINNLLQEQNGRAITCGAGNSGNVKSHVGYVLNNDTMFTWYKPKLNYLISCMISIDSASENKISIAFGSDKNNFFNLGKTNFSKLINIDPGYNCTTDKGYNLGARVYWVQRIKNDDKITYYISLAVDSLNYLFRLYLTGKGKIDLYHYYDYPNTGLVSSNIPDSTIVPDIGHYLMPDNSQTIMGSFTCAKEVITVGNCLNRTTFTDINNTIQFNYAPYTLSANSSRGPTNDGRIKPEIIAAGDITVSCGVLSEMPWFIANQPYKVAPGGMHLTDGGTSTSSPVVAGIIALYLQKNPEASNSEIREYLFSCTTPLSGFVIPGNAAGYGKVNAFNFLTHCDVTPVIDESNDLLSSVRIYPNPSSGEISISFSNNDITDFKIFNSIGALINSIELKNLTSYKLRMNNYADGIYNLVFYKKDNSIINKKIVIQGS